MDIKTKNIVRWKIHFCDVFSPSMTHISVVLLSGVNRMSRILLCRLSWACWGYGNCGQVCRQNYRPTKDNFCDVFSVSMTQVSVVLLKWSEEKRAECFDVVCLETVYSWEYENWKTCKKIGKERIIVRWKINVYDVFSVSMRTNQCCVIQVKRWVIQVKNEQNIAMPFVSGLLAGDMKTAGRWI